MVMSVTVEEWGIITLRQSLHLRRFHPDASKPDGTFDDDSSY